MYIGLSIKLALKKHATWVHTNFFNNLLTLFALIVSGAVYTNASVKLSCGDALSSKKLVRVQNVQPLDVRNGQMSKMYKGFLNGREVVIKVPLRQENLELFASTTERVTPLLGEMAPEYFGVTEFTNAKGEVLRGMVFEKVEGLPIDSIKGAALLKQEALKYAIEIYEIVEALIEKGVIPLDVQILITPEGKLKFIDLDLYLSADVVDQNPLVYFRDETLSLLDFISGDLYKFSGIRTPSGPSIRFGLNAYHRILDASGLIRKALEGIVDEDVFIQSIRNGL